MRKWIISNAMSRGVVAFGMLLIFVILLQKSGLAQESKFTVDGYINNLGTVAFGNNPITETTTTSWDYSFQNRINTAWYATDFMEVHVEFRNRFLWGESVRDIPNYATMLGQDRGFFDLTFNWWSSNSTLMNTQFDRAYLSFYKGNSEVTIGRQRVNWSRSIVWTPNDIFSTYSYYDVDYPERGGVDAINFQQYIGTRGALEAVVAVDSSNRVSAAAKALTNIWSYDLQVLAGYMNEQDVVVGAGWEGDIKGVAFRGEATYYYTVNEFIAQQSRSTFLFDVSFDYVYKDYHAQLEFLYNDPNSLLQINGNPLTIFQAPASAKTLSFSEYNICLINNYTVSPIIAVGASVMYYTDQKGFFIMPTADFSLANNWMLSLYYQYFNMEYTNRERVGSNFAFVNLKWSF